MRATDEEKRIGHSAACGRNQKKISTQRPQRHTEFSFFSVLSVLSAVNLSFLCISVARAQVKYGLTPAMVVQEFKPGQPFTVELTVSNGSARPMLMRGTAMDFWYNEKNEKVFAAPGTLPRSASNWVEFVPRMLTVPAQGFSTVKMVVTPPADASGSYYCVAFIESKPELARAATAETQAMFTNIRLGALVMLAAQGSEKYKVDVSDTRFSAPAPDHDMTLDFQVANESNTHIFPKTAVALFNEKHKIVAKTEGEIKRFLPGQKDRLSVSWGGSLPPGDYTALLTMVYGDDKIYNQSFPFTVAGRN
jgi:hypothetical protein